MEVHTGTRLTGDPVNYDFPVGLGGCFRTCKQPHVLVGTISFLSVLIDDLTIEFGTRHVRSSV